MDELIFRKAMEKDVLDIVQLIWADNLRKLDQSRPELDGQQYITLINKISADPNQYLLVVENQANELIGTCHLTLLLYLPFFDKRVLVEYVRVVPSSQGQGVGRRMFEWIESKSKEWDARLIQLTTDCRRIDAQDFYKSIGFKPSHLGMKKILK